MGMALYRKYRSKNLAEIVGQEHITVTLDNALKKGAISHAYLFTGPRGVGKTSIARILAHEVNGLPYDESVTHIDIIEIDAASNRGIEEIRELREKVHTAPTSAKYKVYIIDEVHMLTTPAFNALLKTLEEPPAHVIFILATTESHKLPETIISRCMRFSFKPIEPDKAVLHLRTIAKTEKIAISDEALRLIAQHGDGSFRDSISLLDQASNKDEAIELDDVLGMLGIAPDAVVAQLLDTTLQDSTSALLKQLANLKEQGYHPAGVARQLGQAVRQRLLAGQLNQSPSLVTSLLRQLLSVPAAHDPEASLEIILLGINLEINGVDRQPALAPNSIKPVTSQKPKSTPKATQAAPIVQQLQTSKTTAEQGSDVIAIWPQILNTVKTRHNTLYGILRMAQPVMRDNNLTLAFSFAFHQKKINESKSKRIISDIFEQLTGQTITVICITEKKTVAASLKKPPSGELDTISNIFGGGEVLES